MKPLVILEGMDGAGKTTLARALAKRLGAVSTHHGAYPGATGSGLAALYYQSMLPALTGAAPVVLDRSWYSEPIYGEVFRQGLDRLGPFARMLERLRWTVPGTVVLLEHSLEGAWATVAARPADELAQRREQLERVLVGYQRARWPDAVLQRNGRSPDELADEVMTYFNADDGWHELRELGVIGSFGHPNIALLVGDQASPAATTTYPFVSFTMAGCSYWLADALERMEVPEDRLTWVNAYAPDDLAITDLARAVALLEPTVVIALGRRASEALADSGVAHETAPHPQHVKRFAYDAPLADYALFKILEEAATP